VGISWAQRRVPAGVIAALCLITLASFAGSATSQVLDTKFWVTNAEVNAMVLSGGVAYLGGQFTYVGPRTGAFVGINNVTGAPVGPFPFVRGIVHEIAADGAGGWYIGGGFTEVLGQPRQNLAHIDAAGNLTAWNPGTNASISAMAFDPGANVLYVGGGFSIVSGEGRTRIAAVDGTTGAPTTWNPGADGSVLTIALFGNTVLVGGSFSHVGGQPRSKLAAIDKATGGVTTWDPDVDVNGYVTALLVYVPDDIFSPAIVYVGGFFTSIRGQTRGSIAAVNASTGVPTSFSPNANHEVSTMAMTGGTAGNPLRIYAGGSFTQIGGPPRSRIAVLDASGAATSWNPDASEQVKAIRVSGNTVYVGGFFSTIGGQQRNSLAAIDGSTGLATSWNPIVGSHVNAIGIQGSTIFVGGQFASVGGVRRNHLAALDLATGMATAWDPDADRTVYAMAMAGGKLYVGGDFTSIGASPRNHIAALDANGQPIQWNPGMDGGRVIAFATTDSTLYVGGAFTASVGFFRNRAAAFNLSNGALTGWDPDANGEVNTLTVSGNTVYLGGSFTAMGGVLRTMVAAVDLNGDLTNWNVVMDPFNAGRVQSILVQGSNVYLGGSFTGVQGRERNDLAIVDATSGLLSTWDPYMDGEVGALALYGTTLYVGGFFNTAGGLPRLRLAAFDTVHGFFTDWNANSADLFATSLIVSGSDLFVCGPFLVLSAWPSGFARLSNAVTAVAASTPDPRRTGIAATPNPFRSDVALRFAVPHDTPVDVGVYDVGGRLIRHLGGSVMSAGDQELHWDGRDDSGALADAGVFFVRVRASDYQATAKVLRMR